MISCLTVERRVHVDVEQLDGTNARNERLPFVTLTMRTTRRYLNGFAEVLVGRS